VNQNKDYYDRLSKQGKAIGGQFEPYQGTTDLHSLFFPDVDFDEQVLNQVIAEHIFREGNKESGEVFLRETGTSMTEEQKC